MMTIYGEEISREVINKRCDDLVGQFYKILPLKENASGTVSQYIESLLRELLGMQSLVVAWHDDGMYASLLGILQYFLDHPECDIGVVKSDVFKAIKIIKRLRTKYTD